MDLVKWVFVLEDGIYIIDLVVSDYVGEYLL